MRHLRSLGFSSLLAIAVAAPASAQMTPDAVWTLLQDYMKSSGAELSVGDTKREADRLVLSNVTLNSTQEDVGTTTFAIPEIVLRDIGDGKVEITASEESSMKSTLKAEEGPAVETEMKIITKGSRTIASGSPEKPVLDVVTESFEMTQVSDIGEATAPLNVSVLGEKITGLVKMDLAAKPQTIDYLLGMERLKVNSAGGVAAAEGGDDSRFEMTMDLNALKAQYVGILPEAAVVNSASMPLLDGKLDYSTGPMTVQIKSSGQMALAAAFMGKSSALKLDFAPTGGTFSYDMQGLAVVAGDAAPAQNDSATNLNATGEVTVPATGTNGAADLEAAHGKVTVELTALTPLLDGIVAAKLASAEDIAGIKMMMAFFTRPGSQPDSIAIDLEQTADGKMLINGEEMP